MQPDSWSCLIWKKTVLVFGRADYHWMHEPILYEWKEGAGHVWQGDRKQTTIIEAEAPLEGYRRLTFMMLDDDKLFAAKVSR
jgi:hypothetical protein